MKDIQKLENNKNMMLVDNIKNNIDKRHSIMLTEIQNNLPEVNKLCANFGKTQSQFMDNMLTVSHPTPIRNIRQIMAEMNKAIEALNHAYYKNRKEEIEIKKLDRQRDTEEDELELELIDVMIEEKIMNLEIGKKYINGAIRKVSNYMIQYKNILNDMGVDSINEIDFEEQEEEYHIKKAFEQGLNAARVNGGRIDEGNQIYLTQLGINGTVANKCVLGYLMVEESKLQAGIEPTIQDQWEFLDEMYRKFKGYTKIYAEKKGMKLKIDRIMIGDEHNEQ